MDVTHLYEGDDLNFVEKDETRQCREHVVLENGWRWEDNVLNVLHAVRLMDFRQQLVICYRYHFFEPEKRQY